VTASSYLIVNADDFGRSPGINEGVVAAHERGIVTSASLMVRWPDADQAVALVREHPTLSVGLHVDLGEWAYRNGKWHPCYEVVALDDAASVRREVARQARSFRHLIGRDPTHIDSHQHVHRREPVRSALAELAGELTVPLRHFSSAVCHCGDFYGQAADGSPLDGRLSVEALSHILSSLRPGVTELCCHPAVDGEVSGMYREERVRELGVLCDERVPQLLDQERIQLVSFAEVVA
jgi:predicted glycoside hydrolase/deacetylase ChbG (UPF0249 family)